MTKRGSSPEVAGDVAAEAASDRFDPVDLLARWTDEFRSRTGSDPLLYLMCSPALRDNRLHPGNAVALNFQRLGAEASERLADLIESQLREPSERIVAAVFATTLNGVLLTPRLRDVLAAVSTMRHPGLPDEAIELAKEALRRRPGGFTIGRDALRELLRALPPETVIGEPFSADVPEWITALAADRMLDSYPHGDVTVDEHAHGAYVLHLGTRTLVEGWSVLYRDLFEQHGSWLRALPSTEATAKALQALAKRDGVARGSSKFGAQLTNSMETVRVAFARKLASCEDVALLRRSLSALAAAVDDHSPFVREAIAEPLSRSGDAAAFAPLVRLLGDPNTSVQKAAAFHLGRYGDRRAIEPLTKVFAETPHPGVREALVDAVAALGGNADALRTQLDEFDPVALVARWSDDFGATTFGDPLTFLESRAAADSPDALWPRGAAGANFRRLGARAADKLAEFIHGNLEPPTEKLCVALWACVHCDVVPTARLKTILKRAASLRAPGRGHASRQIRMHRLTTEWARDALLRAG